MLDKAKSTPTSISEADAGIITPQTLAYSRSKDNSTGYQHQQSQQDIQHGQEFNRPTEVIPESSLQYDNHNAANAFWLNESGSPCFSNVDHLLSPGFFISENTFQPFFPGYDNRHSTLGAYDQMGSASNNVPVDLVYNS